MKRKKKNSEGSDMWWKRAGKISLYVRQPLKIHCQSWKASRPVAVTHVTCQCISRQRFRLMPKPLAMLKSTVRTGRRWKKKKKKTSKDKLPVGGMWLLPITAGICGVTYQENGKYLTFNFLAVRQTGHRARPATPYYRGPERCRCALVGEKRYKLRRGC